MTIIDDRKTAVDTLEELYNLPTVEPMKLKDTPVPDTMAELLRLALDDMDALNREIYKPKSAVWHTPYKTYAEESPSAAVEPDTCNVCLAGAIMARRFASGADEYIDTPYNVEATDERWVLALHAVGELRDGNYSYAYYDISKHTQPVSYTHLTLPTIPLL